MVIVRPLTMKVLRDIARLKGQATAIALIVASGVGVLVMSLAAMQAITSTAEAYYDRYQFADVFAEAKRIPRAVARDIALLDAVRSVEARVVRYTTVDIADFEEPVMAVLVSLPESSPPQINRLVLRKGRIPNPHRADEIIVVEPFAEAHGLTLGDRFSALLNGRKRALQIVGIALSPEFVYTIGPGALMPDDARYGVIWMGESALAAAYDLDGAFNSVAITVWPGADVQTLLRRVDALLEPYGGIGAYTRADQISNWFVMNEIAQLRSIASIMPPIFLIVAAFLTNILLARLVYIERSEIGLLKAFGYTHATMAWHYTKFVLIIAAGGVLLGWILGYLLGRWMTGIYATLFNFPLLVFAPDYDVYLLSAAFSVAAALIGAVAAAYHAASLPPADAMRPPSPPRFQENPQGLQARMLAGLDQPTRIIFRQLLRRPIRTLLTSLGVSAAVAVLVASLQWRDAIAWMVTDFFDNQQRQDLAVTLVESAPFEVARALERLPGILATEAYRSISTRIHYESRQRREALIGIPANGQLEVLRDAQGRSVSLPEHGLLMSTAMAKILGVTVGDAVRVEVLEGRRPTLSVPVAATFETFIGTPVYMHIEALNAALEEPRTTNYLRAKIDVRKSSALFERLKSLPTISGVMLKSAAVDLFNKTIGETMYVVIAFYTGFAVLLAYGVIYNNMRISLSERGRELATLRVLGFSNGEIAYMLFGEAAVLTLIGLPVGCLCGWLLAEFMATGFETELFRLPVRIEPSTYGLAIVLVLFSALTSAALVARRLVRLNLISVLKTRE